MSIDLEKITKNVVSLVTSYFGIFIGVLTSPASTFYSLLGMQDNEKYQIIKTNKFDERPIVFAAISLLIGLLIGSVLSIKDAPEDVTNQVVTNTVVVYVFLWLLYGMVFHFFARALGGQGKLTESIYSLLYVLGTLHPLLLFFIYILSAIFPDAISYDLTLRDPSGYWTISDDARVDLLGFNFRIFYYTVSFVLTSIYLYFPLSIIHKLSFRRIFLLYVIGIIILIGCSSFSIFGVLLESTMNPQIIK